MVRDRSHRRRWRWPGIVLAAAAALTLGAAWLFAGSEVACEELDAGGGPALRCDFAVAAPPEAVWRAFTAAGAPRRYYFDAVLETEAPAAGRTVARRWRFVTGDRRRLLAGGEILAFEPPRRFEQTFRAADLDDPPSRLTVGIEPAPEGSRVTLVHDRFGRRTATYRRFRRAHPLALSALKAWLETGELPLRARVYTFLFKPGMNLVSARAEPWSD